jgi:hypothetical protein
MITFKIWSWAISTKMKVMKSLYLYTLLINCIYSFDIHFIYLYIYREREREREHVTFIMLPAIEKRRLLNCL